MITIAKSLLTVSISFSLCKLAYPHLMPILFVGTWPGKNGHVEDLVIQVKGETSHIQDVSHRAHRDRRDIRRPSLKNSVPQCSL